LSNLKTTVDALPEFISKKSIDLFTKHNVFSEAEIHSRYEILFEGYCKALHIEALTMVDLVRGEIIPACIGYQSEVAGLLKKKTACGEYSVSLEEHLLGQISKLSSCLLKKLNILEDTLLETKEEREILAQAQYYRDSIYSAMSELRLIVDELETLVARKHWPLPRYAELLYSVI